MAEANLEVLLSRLEDRAADLNAASDALNRMLSQIEQRLIAANVGVDVWLEEPVASTDKIGSTGENSWISELLGFTKVGGEWCLATKKVKFVAGFHDGDTARPYRGEYTVGEPAPLLKASRAIRITALRVVPDLVELMAHRAEQHVTAIAEAQARV